jgi:ATP/maltotriose-dependent transcriptional regulator MalT
LIRRGDNNAAARVFRVALNDIRTARLAPRFTSTLGYYAEILGRAGDIAAAHTAIDEALERSDSNEERWCIAELLRIKGDIVRRQDHATALDEAEDYLLRSLDWARRQDSLLWELRAAISFAELRRGQGRLVEARDLLMPVYQRFTEGFGSADLRAAESLESSILSLTVAQWVAQSGRLLPGTRPPTSGIGTSQTFQWLSENDRCGGLSRHGRDTANTVASDP